MRLSFPVPSERFQGSGAEHAQGKIVPVRFKDEDLAKIAKSAKKSNQTVSEWIRSTLATVEGLNGKTMLQTDRFKSSGLRRS
jgi:hypothetical protein